MIQVTQLKSGIASVNRVRDLLGAVRMSRRYSGTWAYTGIRLTKLFGKLCLKMLWTVHPLISKITCICSDIFISVGMYMI